MANTLLGSILSTAEAYERKRICDTGQGLLTQTGDRQSYRTVGNLADGVIYFQSVGLLAGDVVTNVITQLTGAGATVTVSKLGLYDKAGTRLALSADQGTAWQSTGVKTAAMTSAYTVTTSDLYYLAILCKASTLPQVIIGSGAAPLVVGSGAAPSAWQTGQTDLVATATLTIANSLNPWLGCS